MSKTIKLKRPFLWHAQQVTEITLREPKAAEALRIGEPFEVQPLTNGSFTVIDNDAAILAYAEALIDHEGGGKAVLALMGVADALQVKDAVRGFFGAARMELSDSASG